MAINMNSIPTTKPSIGNVIPKGRYKATITKAEMRTPKDTSRPDYFSAECDIEDLASGINMGKFWINLFASDAPLIRFQIGRFIKALALPITGEFELKDLTKIVTGKALLIDITPEEKKDGSEPQRSVVDISTDCFYPITGETNDNPLQRFDDIEIPTGMEPLSADQVPTMAKY